MRNSSSLTTKTKATCSILHIYKHLEEKREKRKEKEEEKKKKRRKPKENLGLFDPEAVIAQSELGNRHRR